MPIECLQVDNYSFLPYLLSYLFSNYLKNSALNVHSERYVTTYRDGRWWEGEGGGEGEGIFDKLQSQTISDK